MESTEILWSQYKQNVELYKFYMELIVKFNIFYYAVTGAIVSFFFANQSIPNIKYSLLLPIIMSIAFAVFFIYGAVLMRYLREDVFNIRDSLELQVAPDVGVLSVLLYMFSVIFLLVAGALSYAISAY
jgi:hypothetical protein